MSPTTDATTRRSPLQAVRKVPIWVWALGAIGAVVGALLAESGDFWGNTVPSAATCLLAGLLLGLAAWGLVAAIRR